MYKDEVAVTGIGVVSPIGNCIKDFELNMFSGHSGVVDIRGKIVHKNFPVPYAAIVDCDDLSIKYKHGGIEMKTRSTLLAVSSTHEALNCFSEKMRLDGIVFNNAEGLPFEVLQDMLRTGVLEYDTYDQEYVLGIINDLLIEKGFGSVPLSRQILLNSACSSGNQAIGVAMQRIRNGDWKSALVGGVDSRCTPSNLLCFHLLNALTIDDVPPQQASRPFSADRSGFVRGEGAATLILESLDQAKNRKAKIFGIIAGYGNTSDAYRLTDGREDGMCVIQAMKDAITDSGLRPKDIKVISAHGTSTPLNDRLETKSIKELFGDHAYSMSITSLKSQIGHTTVAAGVIETISCLLMLNKQKVAPTINYNLDQKDPDCDLDYTPNKAKELEFGAILNNNFGFGGQNACLVIKKYNEEK